MRFQGQADTLIWDRFKAGDLEAFSYIYDTYFDKLYYYGFKIIGNEEECKDCLSEFFLYLWEHRSNLKSLTTIKYYLIKSFRRFAIRFINKQTQNHVKELAYSREIANITFSPEEIISQQESKILKQKKVDKLINKLSNRQKEIIILRYFEELSIKEIASILDIKEQSVVNHLQRIFNSLRVRNSTPST